MTSTGREFAEVERPFVDQLVSMGWRHTTGNLDFPSVTDRETFREVILGTDLRQALSRINRDALGEPWLDEDRISTAISALERLGAVKLMEANQKATALLHEGVTVPGVPGWDGGRERTVQFIDWEHPQNNTFRVIDQFRVDEPGGQGHEYITPDLVLFVNGIPLVVVECKSPYASQPMEQGIDQLQRYSNQRHWVDAQEGNERLFHYNQFLISSYFEEARAGTIGAMAVHYLEWKDTSPVAMAEVQEALGKSSLSSQEILVAGMLRPENLLDIVRHFTLFNEVAGRTIKIVPRYQQYRAVQRAFRRLLNGKTRLEDGEHDRRGGIVWHTQGSGKSFTMVFLVRKMRTSSDLRRFKVVVVTDRKDLQKQLSETAELTGEPVRVARKTDKLKDYLAQRGPGLIFAMIQQYQERDEDASVEDEGSGENRNTGEFPVLNEDESILVMVDEAHRSHDNTLHANLLNALPNCARIGFTGTPIIMGAKKRTHEIFGEFIDRYTIQQSEEDGSTVPILYEGRTTEGIVSDSGGLDQLFEDMFIERTREELEEIKAKYATKGDVMQAPALIAAKARDILRHYVDNILPNGFKAQVVAVSRLATVRYRGAFLAAQRELVERLERLDTGLLYLDDAELAERSEEAQFLVRAHQYLPTIKALEFAPVISGTHNDPVDPKQRWTAESRQKARITRFKKPLFHDDPQQRDPLAFLIVRTMLLTGFDAPVEGVLYLDRPIRQHELLQAIARVNRTYPNKSAGIVVDYYGVARHLKKALAAYSADDVEGVLRSLKDEIPKLRDRHRRVLDVFEERGVDDLGDTEACLEVLRDERVRAEFQVKLKQFLTTLDVVLPRPEALPYTGDAKTLGFVHTRARQRYRSTERPIGKDVGAKVRKLIDDHVLAKGIDQSIPPTSILDAEFEDEVDKLVSPRAKASEMEHALRYHIRKHLQEDPEHYEKLSERLEHILDELHGQWEELVAALRDLTEQAAAGREEDETGLDPETQAPFLGILKQAVGGGQEVEKELLHHLADITVEMVEHIRQEIAMVGFWGKTTAQESLRSWVVQRLDEEDLLDYDKLPAVADRIVDLAKANRHRLVE